MHHSVVEVRGKNVCSMKKLNSCGHVLTVDLSERISVLSYMDVNALETISVRININ